MPKYVGRRIVPKHGGIWDKTKEYEELIIVLCQETGVSYISKLPVPAGTEIFNEHYWAVCSQFSEQIRLAEDHLTQTAENVHTELTETESRISKNVSETEERVTQKLTDTVQNVNDSLSDTTTTLAKKVTDAQKQLEDGRTAMQQSAASLNSRMNSIASGKTTDKETLDARVDSAGKTYDSFGAHLRSRADKFYANGMPFSYTGAVNLNTTEHQLEFSGNFIYLGAKGNKLLTKPEPVPYNPDALLTYISYDTVEGTLVTTDWSDSTKENDVIVFVVDCKYPERSYGYFPFKVDGRMPFGNEMVAIEELDCRVFASAFRYSIEKLQQLYPAAKIYICTPIQGYITTRNYAQTKAKGDYLKLLAGRMSLEVIDTFCCGICDIYEKKNANGRYLIDGLHPNAAGAKKIGVFNASAVIASYR